MSIARPTWLASAAAWSLAVASATPANAQLVQDSIARSGMRDYLTACRQDAGRLWGRSLCGPIILVEPETRQAIASEKPPGGEFALGGGVWVGTVPSGIPLSNTSLTWVGVPWAFVRLPLPDDRLSRVQLLLHESFHRIEDSLHLEGGDPLLPHLDERDGRFWLRMELRAMSAALSATGDSARRATKDALLFRARRQAIYPGTDTLEDAVERHEGMAEYTGMVLALRLTGSPVSTSARSFREFESRPSFVRSLGYGTGPGLGLLLDRYAAGWRGRVAGQSPAGILGAAVGFHPSAKLAEEADHQSTRYGGREVATEEEAREQDRRTRLAAYRTRLIDGPVMVLRQNRLSRSFNPNTLVAFGGDGTVYPTGTFSAEWGALEVNEGGALVANDFQLLRVALPADTAARPIQGSGWTLDLAKGWRLAPGRRAGDLEVVPDSAAAR
jgi:hypothetical protein